MATIDHSAGADVGRMLGHGHDRQLAERFSESLALASPLSDGVKLRVLALSEWLPRNRSGQSEVR
jgi:hypothetical protein